MKKLDCKYDKRNIKICSYYKSPYVEKGWNYLNYPFCIYVALFTKIHKALWNYRLDFVSEWQVKTSNDSKSLKFKYYQHLMVIESN